MIIYMIKRKYGCVFKWNFICDIFWCMFVNILKFYMYECVINVMSILSLNLFYLFMWIFINDIDI